MREPEQLLPEEKTCADCAHEERCLAFGYTARKYSGRYEAPASCDFSPSAFRERPAAPAAGPEEAR